MKNQDDIGVAARIRESAVGFGHLLGLHLKIARLELRFELLGLGLRLRIMALMTAFGIAGYTLVLVGLALLVGGRAQIGVPFMVIGGGHLLLVGLMFLSLHVRKSHFMGESSMALKKSLMDLKDAANAPQARANPQTDPSHVH
jgi:hypothetical protein